MKVSSSVQPDLAPDLGAAADRGVATQRTAARLLRWLPLAWLTAHLPWLAPSLEDIDSINFALGLHHFDPGLHQPHPPGYPVYIALGRLLHPFAALVRTDATPDRVDALALALLSAVAGAFAVAGFHRLCAAVSRQYGGGRTFVASPVWLLACAPLFWMSGLRPMSDMVGLAAALWSQAWLVEGAVSPSRFVAGALLAGLASGIRVQTLPLTVPLILLATVAQWRRGVAWLATRPFAAAVAGTLAWFVPLVVVTGGLAAYRAALGSQAGEDFAWVDMLWANPTPRRLAFALVDSLVRPWASVPLAVVVGLLALCGAVSLLVRAPRALGVMLAAFVPYLVYHLLLQETVTIRYALPLVPLVAWLAAQAADLVRRPAVIAVPLCAATLAIAVQGGVAYGREVHPAFRAIDEAAQLVRTDPARRPAAVFSHFGLRRPLQIAATDRLPVREPERQYEWMGLVRYWLDGGREPVWFFADPKRTDLALIDPAARDDVRRYVWGPVARGELGGTRPLGVDWYRLPPPGWFAAEGWSLTPETGGIVRATATGPDHRPIEAWVRRRPGPLMVMIGGRHLGDPGDPDAEISLFLDDQLLDRWTLSRSEWNFLRFHTIDDGIAGDPSSYARLRVESRSLAGAARSAPVAIRQFDLQPLDRPILGFGEGWHEDEYAPETGLRWRWTSERSALELRGTPQPLRLTLRGESPLKYVDRAPTVRVLAAGRLLHAFSPGDDFEETIDIPADVWTGTAARILIETDRVYLPGPAEGTSDARHLGLRLFETRVSTALRGLTPRSTGR